MREESRYHYLNCLVSIAKIKIERANQEKKWQSGDGSRMMRDFSSYKEYEILQIERKLLAANFIISPRRKLYQFWSFALPIFAFG